MSCIQVIPTKFTFVKIKSRRNFGEFIRFSRMFKSLLKFIKDSNVESVLGFLTLILLRIGCQHNFDNCSWYPNLATCKNWEFLEQGKGSIFNIQGWVGFNNLEKYKTVWAPLVSLMVRTTAPPVPTAFGPWPLPLCHPRLRCRHRTAHSLAAAPLLSSPSIKGAHPPRWAALFLLRPFAASVLSCCHHWDAVKRRPGPPLNLPSPPWARHRLRELPRPPCRRPRLLLCCPILSQVERLRWAGPLRSGWAGHCRGSLNEQCCLLFFLWINSIHSKLDSNFWIS
jgi:hypothetical protein